MTLPPPSSACAVSASPRIGVALGSGSARGLAHIGVLQALVEHGMAPDVVAGSSMGAMVGVMYAADRLQRLESAFRSMDGWRIMALLDPVLPRSGLIDGRKVEQFLAGMLELQRFEELSRPFQAIATDVATGREVPLGRGALLPAVRASIAVPGIFTPVRQGGQVLADGGLVNPVPVSVARAMGAQFVVAVDLNHDIVARRLGPSAPFAAAPAHAELEPVSSPESEHGPSVLSATWARWRSSWQTSTQPLARQFSAWLSPQSSSDSRPLPGIVDMLMASFYISQSTLTEMRLQQDAPDLVIRPPLGNIRFMAFDRADEIIAIGYQSAKQALEQMPRRDRVVAPGCAADRCEKADPKASPDRP
jgi:NTE family protein